MRAVVLHAEGEFPRCESIPDPGPPGRGQLLVRVAAAGVNYADTMKRRGFYLQKPKFPHVPGLEFSGLVEMAGPDTSGWEAGRRVMGMGSGTFAEYLTIDARAALPVPEQFSLQEAAGFPIVFLTAYPMLVYLGHAQAGETVWIDAAAGGVGTAAIQVAKHLGLQVIAGASTDEKLERLRALGADFTINYLRHDFVPLVKEYTGGWGADISLESIGGDFVTKCIQASAPFGRIVVFGRASGQGGTPDLGLLYQNSVSVSAFWLVTLASHVPLYQKVVAELYEIIHNSKIRPIIGGVYDFEQAAEAMRALESRRTFGKLLVKPG